MSRNRYRTTFNPATGEHIQYTVTGRESCIPEWCTVSTTPPVRSCAAW